MAIQRFNRLHEPSAILLKISVVKADRYLTGFVSIIPKQLLSRSVRPLLIHYIAIYRFYVVGCCNLGFAIIVNFNVWLAVGALHPHLSVKFCVDRSI